MSDTPPSRPHLTPLNIATAVVLVVGSAYLMMTDTLGPDAPPAAAPTAPVAPPQGLFQLDDRVYDYGQLPLEFQEPLFQIRKMAHEQQMLVLEQALVATHLRREAERLHLTEAQTLAKLFPQAVPTEEEMQAFYRENQRADTPPFAKIRGEIQAYLTQTKRDALKKELLTQLLVGGQARILLEAPKAPTSKETL